LRPAGLRAKYFFEEIMQLLFRFVIGGLVVSLFAVIGDALKPKSFAALLICGWIAQTSASGC
jgi:hypothetical protein